MVSFLKIFWCWQNETLFTDSAKFLHLLIFILCTLTLCGWKYAYSAIFLFSHNNVSRTVQCTHCTKQISKGQIHYNIWTKVRNRSRPNFYPFPKRDTSYIYLYLHFFLIETFNDESFILSINLLSGSILSILLREGNTVE